MENKQMDLFVVIVLSMTAMLLNVWKINISPMIRLLVGLPLVFFLPGYAMLEFLFPKGRLDRLERWLLVIGASICIAILTGFLLNRTVYGLQAPSWAAALGLITLLTAFAAVIKRLFKPVSELHPFQVRIPLFAIILLAGSILVSTGAIVYARSTTGFLSQSFTQFWMIPANHGQQNVLEIGVTNLDQTTTSYHVVVQTDQRVLQDWSKITLSPGQTWTADLDMAQLPLHGGPVKATLYRLDSPSQVYRMVTWSPGA